MTSLRQAENALAKAAKNHGTRFAVRDAVAAAIEQAERAAYERCAKIARLCAEKHRKDSSAGILYMAPACEAVAKDIEFHASARANEGAGDE